MAPVLKTGKGESPSGVQIPPSPPYSLNNREQLCEGPQPMAYTLGFGKHKDRTLEWLFFNDPGYVWWMTGQGAVRAPEQY